MSFFDRKLVVIQPHSLGVDKAREKIQAYFKDKNDPSSGVKLIDITWFPMENKALFTLDAYKQTIHGRLVITDDYVKVDTDNLPYVALLVMGSVRATVQDMLKSALEGK